MRHAVRDAKRVATCLGFGPRFLHSTGQAYKGGPNTGVFLQITCDDAVDLPVPGQKYTFGVVKAAQARGDFQVLAERDRRALRVHLGADVAAGLATLHRAITAALKDPSVDALTDVVLVLNAGSSSIKFSTFAVEGRGRDLALRHRGAIEDIGSDPRFFALDADGRRVADERVGGGRAGGGDQEDVLPGLLGWIARQTDRSRVVGVGHRVVHGGERFARPSSSTP